MEDLILKIKMLIEDAQINRLTKRMGQLAKENEKINAAAKSATMKMNKGLSETTQLAKKAANDMKKFRFEWLSVMFLGMAMQRAFGGILRASFQTWSAVTEGTNMAGGAMVQLQAAWEFFKFSLFDALQSSGFFNFMVETVLKLVEYWGNLSTTTKGWVASLLIIGFVVGSILLVVGQIMLGLDGISLLLVGHRLEWSGIGTLIGGAYQQLLKFGAAVIATGKSIWAAMSPIVLLAWIFGIASVIVALLLLKNKFGSFGAAIKVWAAAIALAIVGIFQFILQGVETVLDLILVAISTLLNLLAKVASKISGFGWIADLARQGSKMAGDLASKQLTPDLIGMTAQWLDKNGFNPSPVNEKNTNEPMRVVIENPDDVGRSVGKNLDIKSITNITGSNQFTELLKRQGMGDLT